MREDTSPDMDKLTTLANSGITARPVTDRRAGYGAGCCDIKNYA